jgi:hypothetical protein
MIFARHAALPLAPAALLLALGACQSEAEREAERMEDTMEQQADASAAAGSEIAALGLTEAQLLEADLVGLDGSDLGDVEQVRRDPQGVANALVVEVEDSDPDRFVLVPIHGLTTRVDGDDTDLQTGMNAADVAGLPEATMAAAATPPA